MEDSFHESWLKIPESPEHRRHIPVDSVFSVELWIWLAQQSWAKPSGASPP